MPIEVGSVMEENTMVALAMQDGRIYTTGSLAKHGNRYEQKNNPAPNIRSGPGHTEHMDVNKEVVRPDDEFQQRPVIYTFDEISTLS